MTDAQKPRIAVLVPCHNEAVAIPAVIADFRAALPEAVIYVYDNNSTDGTAEVAARAGAVVRREPLQGKGNVVARMFADIEADIYLLVDGDDTYPAASAPGMIDLMLRERLDMVTGARVSVEETAYRPGHRFGNLMLTGMVAMVFGNRVSDMLSGYRAFSRRFVKSFPALSSGFETETELTVHALELRLPVAEVAVPFKDRPSGSQSKLHTFRDGFRILGTIVSLVKRERPLPFFGAIAAILALLGLILFLPVLSHYLATGLVPRMPTFLASVACGILAMLSLSCGLVLDTVTRGRREAKRIAYLSISAPDF